MKTDQNLEMETSVEEVQRLFNLQKASQYKLGLETAKIRKQKLHKLQLAVQVHRQEIRDAMYADFRKPELEVDATEMLPVIAEIKHAKRNIYRWTSKTHVPTPISMLGSSSAFIQEPKGVSLIISPWNFPFVLTLSPLVGAIAAGCPVILKPSENTPHAAVVIKKIIETTFKEEEVAVTLGAVQTATELLKLPFNHIYFTGSPHVGKIVMAAAAKNLASVTMELGGKSPVIVDETANLDLAAKRICWAKFVNTGQVCLTPDYLFVQESIKEEFLMKVKEKLRLFFGEDASQSESFGRIVNKGHFDRINGYLKDAIDHGANFVFGGKVDASQQYIQPTILTNVKEEALIMQDEIFGPVLPVKTYKSLDEVIEYLSNKEKPLALYIYSRNKKNINKIIKNTRSGGTAINHSIVHFFNPNLPFGGSNNSGIGKSGGYYTFLEFSNQRGILKQHFSVGASDFVTPPYTKLKSWAIKFTERWLT